ncbi:hypothetical protein CYLTODRAFT_489826 [Cylindrobasidium torrendii FP15055 ss-10]|uniref:Uncharacterized protein n=1 Tax=Cylindrobasidium torrendii FP15055 ss-10 TaxID=1314674 RepID=A0A0D7BCY4_9AGAR|nr:hypothetical protein CYLTODRAFT_489826 [Cylindrobasidium torrendii FP15055 ss-10]
MDEADIRTKAIPPSLSPSPSFNFNRNGEMSSTADYEAWRTKFEMRISALEMRLEMLEKAELRAEGSGGCPDSQTAPSPTRVAFFRAETLARDSTRVRRPLRRRDSDEGDVSRDSDAEFWTAGDLTVSQLGSPPGRSTRMRLPRRSSLPLLPPPPLSPRHPPCASLPPFKKTMTPARRGPPPPAGTATDPKNPSPSREATRRTPPAILRAQMRFGTPTKSAGADASSAILRNLKRRKLGDVDVNAGWGTPPSVNTERPRRL